MPLDRALADRLAKLLGMTGSDYDGEALAAARKANALLKTAGLTWADVIDQGAAQPTGWREPRDWREAVLVCLDLPGVPLSDWDRRFLHSIATRPTLSDRQAAQLDRIVSACRQYAAMAA
ncbi:hypothetical protein JL101_036400 (plasmid) [Skermanella rosea]|uniref:hypothetical protein n=1 Tax=Skermanella rosea TaxID=1817965 RepID=UPI0019319900|nr:hypothetical protein [Skermanella rosea]UEM08225.1 hypothetical protein JL101_036400 [Skermanella rosea]